jgi:hypothetical protein
MILIASGLSIFNRFMGFFFNGITGIAVLAEGSTNFCNDADFLGDGDLLVNSGVLEEYTDLADEEPRVALFDFGEDTRAEGVVDDDAFGVFVAAFAAAFVAAFGGAFGRLGIIVFP